MSATVHGYARSPNLAAFSNTLHLALATLQCNLWVENQDGEVSRGMLPDKSNQERTGRPLKKVSLEALRKEEPVSKGNLPTPPSLPAPQEKKKKKITAHRPK